MIEDDLKAVIGVRGDITDSWDDHSSCAQLLIKDRLTKGQKFIRPSRTLTAKYGACHIDGIIKERCDIIVRQVLVQLESKSANQSFRKSKELLRQFQKDIGENCL